MVARPGTWQIEVRNWRDDSSEASKTPGAFDRGVARFLSVRTASSFPRCPLAACYFSIFNTRLLVLSAM